MKRSKEELEALKVIPDTYHLNTKGSRFKQFCGRLILRLFGWRVVGKLNEAPHQVITGAPHTSAWELPLVLAIALAYNVRCHWIAKKSVFTGPKGWLMRKLGGVPVDRTQRTNFVDQMVEHFKTNDSFYIGIMPEGTRKRVDFWKTGFYYIATQAEAPITMAFFDYKHKTCGLGPTFMPSGDKDADMSILRDFYTQITPKFPEKFGPIILKEQLPPADEVKPEAEKVEGNGEGEKSSEEGK